MVNKNEKNNFEQNNFEIQFKKYYDYIQEKNKISKSIDISKFCMKSSSIVTLIGFLLMISTGIFYNIFLCSLFFSLVLLLPYLIILYMLNVDKEIQENKLEILELKHKLGE